MDNFKQYLAQKILTEDQPVTYRLLSRALKVHVNTAKEMLYEFHKWQNDKRPGTLHATYLVYGTKKNVVKVEERDGDVEMTDSQISEEHVPFSDDVPTYTLSLIREEQLQDTLAEYDEVTSIHIYSLGPHPLKDLQLLADTARQVLSLSTSGEVPASSKDFGSIANPNVHRRERRRGAASKPVASAPAPKSAPQPQSNKEEKPSTTKEEPKAAPQANTKGPASTATKKPTSAASLKRQSSSGIGQMFAKAAANPKKPTVKPTESDASSAAARDAEEDRKMAMSDDGEDDAEPAPEAKESASARQSRKDRQAELRRMMEESDEEEPEKAESPAEEPMEEEEPPQPEPEPKAEEPAEVVSSTGDGRRRGRRRVTRKKQVMDDKGYLVTIQEQGWESFSEEETPQPPKQKPQPVKSEPGAKPKKAAGKGQGNIMSFFSKK